MEEIEHMRSECIRRSREIRRLLEQDREEIRYCLEGEILTEYRQLMDLELEVMGRLRNSLNDTAAGSR